MRTSQVIQLNKKGFLQCLTVLVFVSVIFNIIELSLPQNPHDSVKYNQKHKPLSELNDTLLRENQLLPKDSHFLTIKRDFLKYLSSHLRDKPYPGVEYYTQYIMAMTGRKPLTEIKPLRQDFGNVINNVTSFQYPIDIEKCKKNSADPSFFVAIMSAPHNMKRRTAIRQTWLRHLKSSAKERHGKRSFNLIGFGFITSQTSDQILQKEIEKESKTHLDILQVGTTYSENNLTPQAVGLINWLHSNCSDVEFVLKVEDNVYVNVNNLANLPLLTHRSIPALYGISKYHETVREGPWKISYEHWPWKAYPDYPTGIISLITGSSIGSLLAAAQTVPFIRFDDAYLLGLCAEKAKIKVVSDTRMIALGINGPPSPCDIYSHVSWNSNSEEHFETSHNSVEDFYNRKTQCVLPGPDGLEKTINPQEDVHPQLIGNT